LRSLKKLAHCVTYKLYCFSENYWIFFGVIIRVKDMNNEIGLILGSVLFASSVCASGGSGIRQVRAEHILVATESEAKEIINQINQGKISFEDAAKKSSQCPSGKNGGDLGYFGRGAMVKEFEDAAFSTEKGKISAPIKTQFGWHIIRVIDKN